jgi:hypothetical protein
MKTSISIQSIFNCSLEKAFKTPMLSDVSKVHSGVLISFIGLNLYRTMDNK